MTASTDRDDERPSGRCDGRSAGRHDGASNGRRAFLAAAGTGVSLGLAGCLGIGRADDPEPRTTTRERRTTRRTTREPTPTPTTEEPPVFEVPTVEPAPPVVVPIETTLSYRVDDVTLSLVRANDGVLEGPKIEEIYGDVYVYGYDARDGSRIVPDGNGESINVHSIDEDEAVSMRSGDLRRLDADATVSFPDGATVDRGNSYVHVGMDVFERDTGPDDVLGLSSERANYEWFLTQAPTEPGTYVDPDRESKFRFEAEDRGSTARVSFNLSPVES